jgi:hypothetical protein
MNPPENSVSFGAPGIEPRWTSSAKEGMGTAYVVNPVESRHEIWSLRHPLRRMPRGKILRILLAAEATTVWSTDDWARTNRSDTTYESGLNLWFADFPTAELTGGSVIAFTCFWKRDQRWDPKLSRFAGRVSDSGEGRWTIKAAIDEGVPVPVLTTALYERFASRGEADFQDKLLSAMRFGFGGHLEKSATGKL